MSYYDGCKLLSMMDLDGMRPELYFCVGNRTAGKTFFFKRLLVNKFLKKSEKFLVLKRYNYEIPGADEAFFKDIQEVKFQGHVMTQKNFSNGMMAELFIDGRSCGYVVAINQADLIKKVSSRFVDVQTIFFDEFQSETNKYCPGEVSKFRSILVSVARGGGKQARHVPVYMCSNAVTVTNPYFLEYGIAQRLTIETKFLRGRGWVLEQTYNVSAAEALRREHRHMEGSKDLAYMTGEQYLLDSENFIEKTRGVKFPLMTVIQGKDRFGVWSCEDGIIFINRRTDPACKIVAAFNTNDHSIESQFFTKSSKIIKILKQVYEEGQMRFADQRCKNVFFDIIGFGVV